MRKRVLSPVHIVGDRCYWVLPTTPPHLSLLAQNMRDNDKAEVVGVGSTIKRALWRGYRNSILCRTALIDGKVAAVWGLCVGMKNNVSLLSDIGVPWMLTTDAVEQLPISFCRQGRREIAAMRAIKPKLESYVAADYVQAVRFLKLLGFDVDEPQPVGVDGALFRRFHIGCGAAETAKVI